MAKRKDEPDDTPVISKEQRDKQIVKLYSNGVPVKQIARQLGVHPGTIYWSLSRQGIEPSRQRAINGAQVISAKTNTDVLEAIEGLRSDIRNLTTQNASLTELVLGLSAQVRQLGGRTSADS